MPLLVVEADGFMTNGLLVNGSKPVSVSLYTHEDAASQSSTASTIITAPEKWTRERQIELALRMVDDTPDADERTKKQVNFTIARNVPDQTLARLDALPGANNPDGQRIRGLLALGLAQDRPEQGLEILEELPDAVRETLERRIIGRPLAEVWNDTADFFRRRDPHELAKAENDPKHRMALVFRWYLGLSSRWAIAGQADRKMDFQIWCGPAMGAFNAWVKGSFLEDPSARTVGQVALNLLEGAARITRASQLRSFGAPVPSDAFQFSPRRLSL